MSRLDFPLTVDVDGLCDSRTSRIRYIGRATLQENGRFICLADVDGCLCRVEVSLRYVSGTNDPPAEMERRP